MITYNINNNTIIPSEFSDTEGKLRNDLTPYEFIYNTDKFSRLEFDKVYYAAFGGHFYAYKLVCITFEYNDLKGEVEGFFHIQLADGRRKKISIRERLVRCDTFTSYEYLENYVRFGNTNGKGIHADIDMGYMTESLINDKRFYTTVESDKTSALRMELFGISEIEGRPYDFCNTEFFAAWIDEKGFHAYVNDKDFLLNNTQLYESKDECKRASRIVYDFGGVKHVEDIKLTDGEIYKVWCEDTSTSYVFVKDSSCSKNLTSSNCYCISVESDADEDYYHDDLFLNDNYVISDDEVIFINKATEEDVEKLKDLISKEKNRLAEQLNKNEQDKEGITNTLDMFNKIL